MLESDQHSDADSRGLNRWFDRIPRQSIVVGTREVPAFRSLGVIGFQVSLVLALVSGLRIGLPLLTTLGVSAAAGLSFFAWGFIRRSLSGREALVLLEHVWVAYAFVGVYLWASGSSLRQGMDVLSISLAPFLAFGRFGCLTVGCCHGTPASVGIRYGPTHPHIPERLASRRLRPVPLIEAIGLLVIGFAGFLFLGGIPGTATVWFLASYAILRFGTEALRGDVRPHVGAVSVPRLMAVAQLAVAAVLSEAWLIPGPPTTGDLVSGAVLGSSAALGLGLAMRRAGNPLLSFDHLDEAWATIERMREHGSDAEAGSPELDQTSLQMTIAVSSEQGMWHISLSHPEHSTEGVAIALSDEQSRHVRGVSHFALVAQDLEADPQTAPYFRRPESALDRTG